MAPRNIIFIGAAGTLVVALIVGLVVYYRQRTKQRQATLRAELRLAEEESERINKEHNDAISARRASMTPHSELTKDEIRRILNDNYDGGK